MARLALAGRVLQVAAGLALFVFALMILEPLPLSRLRFVVIAALLMAGSMAVTDSLAGLLAALVVKWRPHRAPASKVVP